MRHRVTLFLAIALALVVFVIVVVKLYVVNVVPDMQCGSTHTTTETLPSSLSTAQNFFDAANYYYAVGDCKKAVEDYTKAIALNKNIPQFYNNRGYTYMRLREYANAFVDENTAIMLDPNYIQALLNRGDLYNYYGPIIDHQKAIADYEKVISLGAVHDNSVCGHLAMAQTNNIVPLALLKFIFNRGFCK